MAIGILRQFFTRRRLRWAGLIPSILLIGTFAASGKYVAKGGFTINTGGVDSASITISRGGVTLEYGRSLREPGYEKLIWVGWRPNETFGINARPHFWVSKTAGGLPNFGYLYIPLWISIVIIAPLTAYRWWKERAPPPGLCRKCRYSLSGTGVGVCPECGTPPLSKPDAEVHRKRTRRVEDVLIGLATGILAGWAAWRFSLDGRAALCGDWLCLRGVIGGVFGRVLARLIRLLARVIRRTWTARHG